MKRVGHLFDSIVTFENLMQAAYRAMRGKRQKPAVARLFFHLEPEILALQQELQQHTYQPQPYTCFAVSDPKPRDICAAHIRDRVVHHAICRVIEPVLERRQIFDSYACRKGKGNHQAIQRAQQFSRQYRYFFKADIAQYFASISHVVLKRLLRRCFKDRELLQLLDTIIEFPYPGQTPGYGLPLGNLTSQHFANLYLGELDHFVKDRLGIPAYCRYMDDMVLFADDKATLHQYKTQLEDFLQTGLSLRFKPSATRIAPVSEGVGFLGMQIFPRLIRLKPQALQRIRQRIHRNERVLRSGDASDAEITARIQSMLSIIAHLKQANTWRLRKGLFSTTIEI